MWRAFGVTDLVLDGRSERFVVDGILTGIHASDTSHFTLLEAFLPRVQLEAASAVAASKGLLGHEFGDAWLVWGEATTRRAWHRRRSASPR